MKIHDYAQAGDIEGIRREMERGESLEAYDDNGETPLMAALQSRSSSAEIIRSMILLGADVEYSGTAQGWIHKHSAKLLDDQVIEITYGEVLRGEEFQANDRVYHLDLETKSWTEHPQ